MARLPGASMSHSRAAWYLRVLQKGQVFLAVRSAEWQTGTAVADVVRGNLNVSCLFFPFLGIALCLASVPELRTCCAPDTSVQTPAVLLKLVFCGISPNCWEFAQKLLNLRAALLRRGELAAGGASAGRSVGSTRPCSSCSCLGVGPRKVPARPPAVQGFLSARGCLSPRPQGAPRRWLYWNKVLVPEPPGGPGHRLAPCSPAALALPLGGGSLPASRPQLGPSAVRGVSSGRGRAR